MPLRKLIILLLIFSYTTAVPWRSISSISYMFSTCNTTGANGPSNQSCLNEYGNRLKEALTAIPMEQGFMGGQGFKFPRPGLYNITVAGAAGGRGLCNVKTSKGVILTRQVLITETNDSVLVLVGQKGVSPCDSNSNYSACQSPPSNVSEAERCLQEWLNESMSFTLGDRLGGGGGGGASMVWAPNATTGNFNASQLPFLIAAGGGGTSLATDYSAILGQRLGVNITSLKLPSETVEEFYQKWINGRPYDFDAFLPGTNFIGNGGNRPNIFGEGAAIVAGSGSGWTVAGENGLGPIDGNLLSTSVNFAQGGLNCVTGLGGNENNLPFQEINGGFGGGGGGCDEGGGGGGYGGGSVLGVGQDIPGGGGYSYLGNDNDTTFIGFNNGSGYVHIVPSDCGCQNGCIVNEGGLMYMCICPFPATLAPNGIDCYELNDNIPFSNNDNDYFRYEVTGGRSVHSSAIKFSTLQEIYALNISLSIKNEVSVVAKRQLEVSPCTVVWLNQSLVPVCISESSNGYGTFLNSLRVIYNADNGNFSSNFVTLLEEPLSVVAGVILGSRNCSVDNITLSAVVTANNNAGNIPDINIQDVINNYTTTFNAVISNLPNQQTSSIAPSSTSIHSSTVSTTTTNNTMYTSSPSSSSTPIVANETSTPIPIIAIAAPVGGGIILIVIILIFTVIACVVIKRRRSTSIKRIYQIHSKHSIDDLSGDSNQLQKLRYRLASLKANPNYGEQLRLPDDDETDDGKKVSMNSDGTLTSSLEHSYAPMVYDREKSGSLESKPGPHRIRSRSRRRTFTLRPKYGVMSPSVNFYELNTTRSADDDWEYDRTQLTYLREIGEGQFGKVLLMKAKNIAGYKGKLPVAVKTLSSIENEDIKKFLEEIELMKKFANANIVSLLGVSTESSEGAPLMILEYMPYGDLQSFLVRHKPKPKEGTLIGLYYQLRFAGDIANAMAFLEKNKYVHRDVAARNCLVGPSLEVKVADFGMARVVQEKDYYRIAGRAVLPVRWMAPESLLYGIFASSSDVWAFGVLLWEIASYGAVPLESCKAQEIVEMAQQQTLNHQWPINGPEELMELKEQCHNYESEKRPRFEDIANILPSSPPQS